MKSPFKFLDSYGPEDKNEFFGRKKEIEELYDLVFKSRLTLVYGQSGAGKTSLVQAGLSQKFASSSWLPITIHREGNLITSWKQALKNYTQSEMPIKEAIERITKEYLKPVYLIFDQLEELFILGKEEEQNEFLSQLKALLNSKISCRIILIIREEFLGFLYKFEKEIPHLFERRLRLEAMSLPNAETVIQKSCDLYNIALQDTKHNLQQITKAISDEKSGIQLAYLQVYMDSLWKDDYARYLEESGGKEWEAAPDAEGKDRFPALEFTTEEIHNLGEVKNVLRQFVRKQKAEIQTRLEKEESTNSDQEELNDDLGNEEISQTLPQDAVSQVLDIFVSPKGTKHPVLYSGSNGTYKLEEEKQTVVEKLPYNEIISDLEEIRILNVGDKQIELAHDSLAAIINEDRSSRQLQINEARRRIDAALTENQSNPKHFLSANALGSIREVLPQMNLSEKQQVFVKDSIKDAAQKRRKKILRNISRLITAGVIIGLAIIVILGGTAGYFIVKSQNLEAEKETLVQTNQELDEDYQNVKEKYKNLYQELDTYSDTLSGRGVTMIQIKNILAQNPSPDQIPDKPATDRPSTNKPEAPKPDPADESSLIADLSDKLHKKRLQIIGDVEAKYAASQSDSDAASIFLSQLIGLYQEILEDSTRPEADKTAIRARLEEAQKSLEEISN